MLDTDRPWLEAGFARAGGGESLADLEIQPMVGVSVSDDLRSALGAMKPSVALCVGGMGHRNKNFHDDKMVRRGYGERYRAWEDSGATGLTLTTHQPEALEFMADLAGTRASTGA